MMSRTCLKVGFKVLISLLAFSICGAFAEDDLQFEKVVDLGEVFMGSETEYRIPITRTSEQAVRLTNIMTSCPCLTAVLENSQDPQYEESAIVLTLDAVGGTGFKEFVVEFEEGEETVYRFKVKTEVVRSLNPVCKIMPRKLYFLKMGDKPASARLQIENQGSDDLIVHLSEASRNLQFESKTLQVESEEKVTITVLWFNKKECPTEGEILVASNDPIYPEIRVPYSVK